MKKNTIVNIFNTMKKNQLINGVLKPSKNAYFSIIGDTYDADKTDKYGF
jgi:hypothetical protein